ncbi:spore coat protein CotJB [Phocea massiliensis]|uniref:Spore coat protein CotJB n=1 Tax=Merdimmobilis hominis TaxID=2897707 RepID=A0A938X3Q1_9FIRM|nr:spore coat protein CotJB [Merdimmobilis hominis]MBM6919621.1 spore coat protein CotJB [Merdimmobilis hominis]
MSSDKQKLLRKLQVADFALSEAVLFLDTHPSDEQALAYFHKQREGYDALYREYTEKFGPLRAFDNRSKTRWEWADGPWPWEYEANV